MIDTLLKTLETGSGIWNPLIWILAIVIALLLAYTIRSFGKKGYKEKTGQTQAFLSGNPEYEKEKMHVAGKNLYWGFTETMKNIYNLIEKMHTGNTSAFVLWFVIILAIFFLLLGVL